MKILIDINHPAHVHFYKNVYWELIENNHEVLVTAGAKDVTIELLNEYSIPFTDVGIYKKSQLGKVLSVIEMGLKFRKIINEFSPDIAMGIASSRICHGAIGTATKTFVFTDTEHAKAIIKLFKPFATKIFTPDCFTKDIGPKQVRYPGYHELAYLHPNRFTPNPEVLTEIGLKEGEPFFVLRFVSWGASHDIGQKGLTDEGKRKLIDYLKDKGKIIITSESPLPKEFEEYRMSISPTKMHDLLYYASMYIGESGTMASEASLLGTPSVLINTLAKQCGNHISLNQSGLQYFYDDLDYAFYKIQEIIENEKSKKIMQEKLDLLLNSKIDLTDYIINYIILKQY